MIDKADQRAREGSGASCKSCGVCGRRLILDHDPEVGTVFDTNDNHHIVWNRKNERSLCV